MYRMYTSTFAIQFLQLWNRVFQQNVVCLLYNGRVVVPHVLENVRYTAPPYLPPQLLILRPTPLLQCTHVKYGMALTHAQRLLAHTTKSSAKRNKVVLAQTSVTKILIDFNDWQNDEKQTDLLSISTNTRCMQ